MKHNDIMPECYIDSTLVGSLLDAQVNHKHCCNDVAKEMEKGKHKDSFAVGIIDNDKRKISYVEEFDVIGRTDNLVCRCAITCETLASLYNKSWERTQSYGDFYQG